MLETTIRKELRDYPLDLSFIVHDKEILVLMGRNGSGKSTILNCIAGLVSPGSGSIRNKGAILFNSDSGIEIPPERRGIGYVSQKAAVFPHLSVRDNLAYGLRARHACDEHVCSQVDMWLDILGIRDLRDVRASQLSGGQQQKVALARALAISPGLLLLDEPFTALDAKSISELMGHIRSTVNELNIPSILVTHRFSDAALIGDRVCLIKNGRVVSEYMAGDLPSFLQGRREAKSF